MQAVVAPRGTTRRSRPLRRLLELRETIADLIRVGRVGTRREVRAIVVDGGERMSELLVAEAAIATERRLDGQVDRVVERGESARAIAGARTLPCDGRIGSSRFLATQRELAARLRGLPGRRRRRRIGDPALSALTRKVVATRSRFRKRMEEGYVNRSARSK